MTEIHGLFDLEWAIMTWWALLADVWINYKLVLDEDDLCYD